MSQDAIEEAGDRLEEHLSEPDHCLRCGEELVDDAESCPSCGAPHMPSERFDLLTHRAALNNATVEQLGLRVPPLAYRKVRSRTWFWVDILTLNYLIVGGFLVVPIHATRMIDAARHELLDYKKELLAGADGDRLYCRSCATPIRVDVGTCPHCGEVNPVAEIGSDEYDIHDPDEYETDVSGWWWIGLVVGTFLAIIVPTSLADVNGTLAGVGYLGVVGLIAASVYHDAQYIRANGRWDPSTILWIVGLAIPVLNVGVLISYLWTRRRAKKAAY